MIEIEMSGWFIFLIGLIIGLLFGMVVAFYTTYRTEVEFNSSKHDRFSDGWEAYREMQKEIEERLKQKKGDVYVRSGID